LLGASAEAGLHGVCLLGEMPHVFAQLPFPKASLAVLETFVTMFHIDLDFAELQDQAKTSEEQLGELLARVEEAYGRQPPSDEEEVLPEPSESKEVDDADRRKIESLFNQAKRDRSKAFELKRELDRLNVFKDYEDRFLDLFKKPG
jgi:hypothetical protein